MGGPGARAHLFWTAREPNGGASLGLSGLSREEGGLRAGAGREGRGGEEEGGGGGGRARGGLRPGSRSGSGSRAGRPG